MKSDWENWLTTEAASDVCLIEVSATDTHITFEIDEASYTLTKEPAWQLKIESESRLDE